ncbi:MAG: hypothetical protein J6T01_04480 [Kiritimatiellae bacterium]|nr:hypothetical protein [Kiritimatiellia bacterium]
MIKNQLVIAAALLVGVAIGYCIGEKPSSENSPPENAASAGAHRKHLADEGESARIRALCRRIAELEKALADETPKPAAEPTNAVAEVAVLNQPRPGGNPREWLENLKKDDPARYAQVTNNMARWRSWRAERTRSTIEFLSSIDTSQMSDAAKKTHTALQELIARRDEIEETLHKDEIDDEERRKLMGELHATFREMHRLNMEERTNLFEETAKNLGFSGQDVKDIAATIQEVINATGGNHMGPPPGGGPRRGPVGARGGGAPGGR